jgi:hypothetical protein
MGSKSLQAPTKYAFIEGKLLKTSVLKGKEISNHNIEDYLISSEKCEAN